MMNFLKLMGFAALIACGTINAQAAKPKAPSVEPPFWWTGMNNHQLQLMVHGDGVRDAQPSIDYAGVSIDSVARLESPNYQIIYLNISDDTKPGYMPIAWKVGKKTVKANYELRARDGKPRTTFDSSDLLYLIMPDRFADGDQSNNKVASLRNQTEVDRTDLNARHGGDLKGIDNHLGYLDSLGVTAIWLNPVLENDMPGCNYHGYATTDYYKVDPRFGSNDDYRQLIAHAHSRGIKVVMDMIFNHCGSDHPWLHDLPSRDWLNHPDGDLMTNFTLTTVNDPYASDSDKESTVKGWFVPSMPDLNQLNPHVMKYLIQNSIWWVEYSGIDGIRMDTYPYADAEPMAQWISDLQAEYPGYNVVGESWYEEAAGPAYWQSGCKFNDIDTKLPIVMDFATMINAPKAFGDDTDYGTGLNLVYGRLSQDYLYANPQNILTFLDNHDTDRFLRTAPANLDSWKQAIAFLLTSRGIPQIYYGTELLMTGTKKGGDGNVRLDMPGGFPGDDHDEFIAEGRTDLQNEAFQFLSRLANWRKHNDVVAYGKLKHFIPQNGLYVYERRLNGRSVVVLLNGNDHEIKASMGRYAEVLPVGATRSDFIAGKPVTITDEMTFAPRAVMILE